MNFDGYKARKQKPEIHPGKPGWNRPYKHLSPFTGPARLTGLARLITRLMSFPF